MYIDIIFLLLYCAIPICVVQAMRFVGLRLMLADIRSILILSLLVFSYAGVMPLYFGLDEQRLAAGIHEKNLLLQVFFMTTYAIFGLIGGYFIVERNPNLVRRKESVLVFENFGNKQLIIFVLLSVSGAFTLKEYLDQLDNVAILAALYEGVSEINFARSEMANNFPGKYHWYKILMIDVANFSTFTLFSAWLAFRKTKLFIFFIAAFFVSTFSAVMATEKAPFIWLLAGLYLCHSLVRNQGRLSAFHIMSSALLSFVVLIAFYILFMGVSSPFDAASYVISRAFAGSIAPAYYYLEYFPAYKDFLWGEGFPNPGGIFPFIPFRHTVEIMNWKFPNLFLEGVVGSVPTVFWAEFYANFGLFGVFLAPPVVGIAVAIISECIDKLDRGAIKIGFTVWAALFLKDLSVTGASGLLLGIYMPLMFVLLLLILLLARNPHKQSALLPTVSNNE